MVYFSARYPRKDLIEAAQAGDPSAQERLYAQYERMVYATAIRFTGEANLAEDICQDTWICALQRMHEVKNPSHFPSWLHTIAVNTARTAFRADKRRAQREAIFAVGRIGNARDHENYVILRVTVNATLPEGECSVLLLRAAGLRHCDIGVELGICPGTSKSQLSKARKRLVRRLTEC